MASLCIVCHYKLELEAEGKASGEVGEVGRETEMEKVKWLQQKENESPARVAESKVVRDERHLNVARAQMIENNLECRGGKIGEKKKKSQAYEEYFKGMLEIDTVIHCCSNSTNDCGFSS
jgi:hypothetical protein